MKIFITGVSSGVGRELTKKLVRAGHEVWGVGRRKELLEDLADELKGQRANFFYSLCDVSEEAQAAKVTEEMEVRGFLPEVVILNAAIFEEDLTPFYNYPLIKKIFSINLNGSLIWIDKFIDKFLKRGSGHFIVIASTSAFRPIWAGLAYPASKAALAMAFRGLRLYFKKSNIKFSTVYFGPIATAISPGYLAASGWKKFFFVISPEKAARCLLKVIKGKKDISYFPFLITLIFRLTLFLPDYLFVAFSQRLKKKQNDFNQSPI